MPSMRAPNYDDPNDPFTMVSSPWGELEKWRADALATGAMSVYDQYLKTVRADAVDAGSRIARIEEREQELEAREAAINDATTRLCALADQVVAERASLEAWDAKLQARAVEHDDPPVTPPGVADAEEPVATHHPGGDLHAVEAKDPEEDDPAVEPPNREAMTDKPAPIGDARRDAGGIPLSYGKVPESFIKGGPQDEETPPGTETPTPADPGPYYEPDPAKLAHPQEPPAQPVSISLNED
jgi:hypothetical protein